MTGTFTIRDSECGLILELVVDGAVVPVPLRISENSVTVERRLPNGERRVSGHGPGAHGDTAEAVLRDATFPPVP